MRLPIRLAAFAALACALSFLTPAFAQQNWRWANSLPASIQWMDVAFGNSTYVAVGGDGTIATSPDGVAWTIRRMSTANMSLNAVAFADGKFVAVGSTTPTAPSGVLIMTSTDGISWTINDTVASANTGQLYDVIYANGTWVVPASSAGAAVFVSTDAQTWRRVAVTASGLFALNTGCFGGGKFVFATNGDSVVTSTDTNTWSKTTVAANAFVMTVGFANGKYVATGRDNNFNALAWTSTDAITWTPTAAIPGGNSSTGIKSIATNGSLFVAGASATQFYSSADGATWTQRTPNLPTDSRQTGNLVEPFAAVAYANNQFFALGTYGSIITSPDGVTWTRRSTGTVNDLGTVIHDGTRFVASGGGGTILTSTDGSAWTQLTTGSTSDFNKLAYNGTRYVAVGFSGILQSTNLTAWTSVAGTTSERYSAVVYGNSRFLAIAFSARTSTDGVTWSASTAIATGGVNPNGLAFGNGVFVIVSSGGGVSPRILSSTDGAAWTDRTPAGFSGQFESLAFGGGRFVALTYDKRTLTSTDGTTWTVNSIAGSISFTTINYVGSQFVARSSAFGAQAYASTDGITWTALDNSLTTNLAFAGVATAGNTVVAVSGAGAILRADRAGTTSGGGSTGGGSGTTSTGGRLANMSIRTGAGTGDNTLIVGLGLGGAGTSGNKAILIRGIGPTLSAFGVPGTLADPVMAVFQGNTQVAANDDWAGSFDFASVGAFALSGNTPRDAAIYNAALPANSYSIQIVGKNGTTGIALAEIYDATPAASFTTTTPRLVNVSARTQVGTGDNILIAGFVVGGQSSVRVLIRAVGPTLGAFGVNGALADPKLEIYSGTTKINENDNWGGTADLKAAFTSVAAFALASDTSRDAALVATLAPGAYTAQISGIGGTTGVALVELYELP